MVVESSDSSLFLKRNLCLRAAQAPVVAETVQQRSEQVLVQRRGPMRVGVGQVDLLGAFSMPRCTNLPRQQASPLQISRNESARASWQNSMATNWVQQVKPCVPLRVVLLDQRGEFGTGKMLEQLTEQAGDLYDGIALLWAAYGEAPAKQLLAKRQL